MVKLLAISSSPVKKGNNEYLTSHMLETAKHQGCDTQCFNLSEMKIEECLHCISPLGASAVSSRNGEGLFERDVRCGVIEDKAGLKSGEMLIKRAMEVAKALKGEK